MTAVQKVSRTRVNADRPIRGAETCAYRLSSGLVCEEQRTGGSQYCEDHKCEIGSCTAPRIDVNCYCVKHQPTCAYILPEGGQCANQVVGTGRYCERHRSIVSELEVFADLEIFKVVSEHYRQDLREYWARTNVFVVAEAALLAGLAALLAESVTQSVGGQPISIHQHDLIIITAIDIVGLMLSVIWGVVARASREWIRRWRQQMMKLDAFVDRHHCYRIESREYERPRMQAFVNSPTRLTLLLPWLFGVAWIGILLVLWRVDGLGSVIH